MNKEVEYVDLVDGLGKIQKPHIPRSDVHLFPDLHMQIVVGVIFDAKKRVLVHKRAAEKKVNPNDIDHVCGGVMAGETPEEAFIRESREETGIEPRLVQLVTAGVNEYNRYRHLLIGKSDEEPHVEDSTEVSWVGFMDVDVLEAKRESGEMTFVDGFFEDTELALNIK